MKLEGVSGMKLYIRSNLEGKTYIVPKTLVKIGEKAIGVSIGRDGRHPVVTMIYLPLSVVQIKERGQNVILTVPGWLREKKGLSSSMDIIQI